MLTKNQKLFLGINDKEFKVLIAIQYSAKTIFTISKETKIPRSTLYPIIVKLYERGFIRVKSKGERFFYKMTSTKEIISMLESLTYTFKH